MFNDDADEMTCCRHKVVTAFGGRMECNSCGDDLGEAAPQTSPEAEAEVKLPSRGPFVHKLANGNSVDVWYNREYRSWVVQLLDPEGNQIGPGYDRTAVYVHSREQAIREVRDTLKASEEAK